MCFAPTKDPFILVGDSTVTLRDTVKGCHRILRYDEFRSVGGLKFLSELIPRTCSWVELCYLGGSIIV